LPANSLAARVLIPEPNLWTDATPFVYEGTLDLWQDGQREDQAPILVTFKGSTAFKV
jgi:hypothetical protein